MRTILPRINCTVIITVILAEAERKQRNRKENISHAEVVALIRPKIRTVTRPIQINLVEQGLTGKRMECCDGRGQRSINDVAECEEPHEKLATPNELICVFSDDKSEFKMA